MKRKAQDYKESEVGRRRDVTHRGRGKSREEALP
jgi:hypothetical protein